MHVDDEDKAEMLVYLDSQNGNAGQHRKAIFIQTEGKEWFCLSDVRKALALTTPAKVKQRLTQGGGMSTIHTPVINNPRDVKKRLQQRGMSTIHTPVINNPRDVKKRLQLRGVVTIDTPTYNQHGTMVMQPMTYIDGFR